MSVASSSIKCDKCDYTSSMSVTHGIYRYVVNDTEYNINRSLGWCYDCKQFVAMEYRGIHKTIETQIKEAQEKIKSFETAGFWARMKSEYKILKRDYNYYLRKIQELEWRISFQKNNKRQPKCLVCGSINVESINAGELDYYNPGPDKKQMDFKHPECGGEFWLIRNPVMWNVRYEPLLYDVDGNKLI